MTDEQRAALMQELLRRYSGDPFMGFLPVGVPTEPDPHRDLPPDFKPSKVPRSLEAWCRGED